jgi:hypothetical protein
VNVRVLMPSPHVALQSLYALNKPWQSIGHGPSLHACASGVDTQAAPPLLAGWVTLNVRVCVPSPHVVEHAPNALKLPTQSTGHAPLLHGRDNGVATQASPPNAAG